LERIVDVLFALTTHTSTERKVMKFISLRQLRSQTGAVSAEYATVAIAACGAGGILYKILTSGAFAGLVTSIIEKAFSWIFNLG
jgi:hypothetical protein